MTIVDDRYARSATLSDSWLDVLTIMRGAPGRRAVHVVLRIDDPTAEDLEVRAAAQGLIDELNARKPESFWDVMTTRNTMFPASWAARHPEPEDLGQYYRDRYADLRQVGDNRFGTYFGRLVAYPRGERKHVDTYDQLSELVRKLRQELSGQGGAKSSRYEVNVYSERHDTNPMSFPCLAHLSFHIHDGRLSMQAVYRNELIVGRAYGNYLGLAQLLEYVCAACPPLQVGEMMVCVNHAELDGAARYGDIDSLLGQFSTA